MNKKFEMVKSKNLSLFALGLLLSWQVQAQMAINEQVDPASIYGQKSSFDPIGQHDLRLVAQQSPNCDSSIFYVDIEVRASSPTTLFRLSDQNYRLRFDLTMLANPRIEQELDISGFVLGPDGNGSFYGPHTMVGSLGEVVSYNVELAGGAGYQMDTTWLSIGRIAFDVVDPIGCVYVNLIGENSFPPTYVGEIDDGNLYQTDEGIYSNFVGCVDDLCADDCPITLDFPDTVPDGTHSAKVSVHSGGTVLPGRNVAFKAGNDVILGAGFSVEAQADFSAEIEGCVSGEN